MRPIVAALLLIGGTSAAGLAQTRSADAAGRRLAYWGFIGLGPGKAADSGFYASGVGVAVQTRCLLFMGRIASLDTKTTKRVSDVGVLVGLATRPAPLHFAFAAGFGVAKDSRDSSAIDLPVEAEATWQMTGWVGLGVRGFLGANKLANFSGLTIALQLGRLR
jgi:hypothetical protein